MSSAASADTSAPGATEATDITGRAGTAGRFCVYLDVHILAPHERSVP